MNDSFKIEGRYYISAKRASEISDYSADYVGQLCRGKKVDCRRIGRSWYVTEESLNHHIELVLQDEVYRNRVINLRGGRKALDSHKRREASGDEASITYESDHRDLLPLLSNVRDETRKPEREYEPLVTVPELPESGRSIVLRRVGTGVFAVLLIVGIVLASSYATGRVKEIVAVNAQSAGVYEVVQSIGSYFRRGYESVITFFSRGRPLAKNIPEAVPSPVAGRAAQGEGIAISPTTGSAGSDDLAKQKIRDSFSDAVDIRPDQSGTTGVITPIFRQARG
ncbi:MAG: hypothetical protein QOG91_172, partial [Candidatus Parcubacteria bacterium]|nr:hypothetical protein [Candidatus Parcubacteria bacterium]